MSAAVVNCDSIMFQDL